MSILHVPIKHQHNTITQSVVKYNLINFRNLLIDMGSLSGAGRLFHNIGPLNLIDRFPNVDCTEEFTLGHEDESRSAPGGRQLVGQPANLTLESLV